LKKRFWGCAPKPSKFLEPFGQRALPSPVSDIPMPHKHNATRRHHIPKMSFKVQNWPAYESACGTVMGRTPASGVPVIRAPTDEAQMAGTRNSARPAMTEPPESLSTALEISPQ
jgi:hypothetical protein